MQYVVVDDNNNVRKVILTMLKVIYTRIVHKNLFNAEENNSNHENAIGIVFMYANKLENMYIFGEFIIFFCLFYFAGFPLRIKKKCVAKLFSLDSEKHTIFNNAQELSPLLPPEINLEERKRHARGIRDIYGVKSIYIRMVVRCVLLLWLGWGWRKLDLATTTYTWKLLLAILKIVDERKL